MSRARWVFSALLVLHVSAMALGAIPAPESLHPGFPARGPTDDPVAASLTGPVDSLARVVYRVAAVVSDSTAPFSKASRSYLRSMGLGQQWTMFWNPPKEDEYLRLRYYVG